MGFRSVERETAVRENFLSGVGVLTLTASYRSIADIPASS